MFVALANEGLLLEKEFAPAHLAPFCDDAQTGEIYHFAVFLTHSYQETHKRVIGNSADPDQMPHNVTSDQDLYCLLTGFSIKKRIKATK